MRQSMLIFLSHPDFTGVSCPAVPALTGSTVANTVPCTDQAIMLVALPVVTFAEVT